MNEKNITLRNVGLTLPSKIKLSLKSLREKKRILSGLNFELAPGEIVALMGRNGSGKSTLYRLLSQIYTPSEGEIILGGNQSVAVMAFSMGFMPALSGRENMTLQALIAGMNQKQANKAAKDAICGMRYSMLAQNGNYDMPYHTYSAGMKATIASSAALLKQADVLLVDEVFGVGDEAFRNNLSNQIRERAACGASVLIVSHDLKVIENLCNRAIVLEDGKQIADNWSIATAIKYLSR